MPKFTIERTYDVPHYRHRTYEAATLEEALKMDAEWQDWSGQKADFDNCGPERVTGAWAGEEAYHGDELDIPPDEEPFPTNDVASPASAG